MAASHALPLALPLLLCFACSAGPTRPAANGHDADESCLFTADKAAQIVALNMQTIDAMRASAAACNTQTASPPPFPPTGTGAVPTPNGPAPTAAAVKSSYEDWLGSVSSALLVDGSTGIPQSTADAAQQLSLYLNSCAGGFHLPDCGHNVNCQRGEAAASSFYEVGQHIVTQFKGCPRSIREKASGELYAHHDWQ